MILLIILISLILLPKLGIVDLTIIPLGLYSIFLFFKQKKLVLSKFLIEILLLWLIIFILALFTLLYHGNVSVEVIFKPLRQIILIFLLTYVLTHKEYSMEDIFKIVLIASLINSIVVILQYILHMMEISGDFLMIGGFDKEINVVFRKPGLF